MTWMSLKSPQGSKVKLLLHLADGSMRIYVRFIGGKVIELLVNESDTIDNIMTMVYKRMAVPEHRQRIVFAGQILRGDLTLAQCNVQMVRATECLLHIMYPMC